MEKRLQKKLSKAFCPSRLTIENQSHLHKGHAGSPETGESHFKINITSSDFEGLSQIQRHQKIYKILEEELKTSLHALSIRAKTPDEETPNV